MPGVGFGTVEHVLRCKPARSVRAAAARTAAELAAAECATAPGAPQALKKTPRSAYCRSVRPASVNQRAAGNAPMRPQKRLSDLASGAFKKWSWVCPPTGCRHPFVGIRLPRELIDRTDQCAAERDITVRRQFASSWKCHSQRSVPLDSDWPLGS
jgi:hypothetical protein